MKLLSLFVFTSISVIAKPYMSCEKAFNKRAREIKHLYNVSAQINLKENKLTYTKKNNDGVLYEYTESCDSLIYKSDCKSVLGVSEYARKCDDGTVSYYQPSKNPGVKSKKSSYEGLCGPTAAANLAYAYCEKNFFYSLQIAGRYFNDITPGVRPDTLASGLNKLFKRNSECMSGEWKYYYSTSRYDFLDNIYYHLNSGDSYITKSRANGTKKKISPFAALISPNDGETLHWVTVVDIYGYKPNIMDSYKDKDCKVLYNEYARQTLKSCKRFVEMSNSVDNSFLTSGLSEYTTIKFEPSLLTKLAKELATQAKKSDKSK